MLSVNKLSEFNKRVNTEGAVHRADVLGNGFLKILQYSEQNTCAGVCF